MTDFIQLKLFAGLAAMAPPEAPRLAIEPSDSVRTVLVRLGIPVAKAHLIFIDGVKRSLDTPLTGGERVGIFPPVAGG